jgi:hypothetical protein
VNVHILTDLATKYKAVLLESPEVFVLVFALGCTVVWFMVHTRVGNAKSRVEVLEERLTFQKERAEHFKARLEALELQNLKTSTPPKFEREDPG